MPGNGRISGGSSARVYFNVNGKKRTLVDRKARVNRTKITVRFPRGAFVEPRGNGFVVTLGRGDCIKIRW